ncbi:MAG: hypothetical protein D6681_02060 [Calditrichaeota bacterium]|nr:MAG: hypothetical protein D6681_02060 [Calditrichota bacterium]
MSRFKSLVLMVALAAFLSGMGTPAEAHGVIVVKTAPPPVKVVVRPARPFRGAVWIPGHWAWRHGHWVWVSGRWVKPRKGYVWVPGHWAKRPRGWVWIPGHWKRI